MADDARVLALKRIEALMAKARDLLKTEQGAEEGRTCAALVLSIIETHGFKITDPTPPRRRLLMEDIFEHYQPPRSTRPDTSYSTGVACVYCKRHVMFREQYTEVEGGVVHDRCFEGYETQRKHHR
jgi:hypothetical protein